MVSRDGDDPTSEEDAPDTLSRRKLFGILGGGTLAAGAIGLVGYTVFSDDEKTETPTPDTTESGNTETSDPDPQDLVERGEITDIHPEPAEVDQDLIERENEEIEKIPDTGASPPV